MCHFYTLINFLKKKAQEKAWRKIFKETKGKKKKKKKKKDGI
jgi:hypothetical protein